MSNTPLNLIPYQYNNNIYHNSSSPAVHNVYTPTFIHALFPMDGQRQFNISFYHPGEGQKLRDEFRKLYQNDSEKFKTLHSLIIKNIDDSTIEFLYQYCLVYAELITFNSAIFDEVLRMATDYCQKYPHKTFDKILFFSHHLDPSYCYQAILDDRNSQLARDNLHGWIDQHLALPENTTNVSCAQLLSTLSLNDIEFLLSADPFNSFLRVLRAQKIENTNFSFTYHPVSEKFASTSHLQALVAIPNPPITILELIKRLYCDKVHNILNCQTAPALNKLRRTHWDTLPYILADVMYSLPMHAQISCLYNLNLIILTYNPFDQRNIIDLLGKVFPKEYIDILRVLNYTSIKSNTYSVLNDYLKYKKNISAIHVFLTQYREILPQNVYNHFKKVCRAENIYFELEYRQKVLKLCEEHERGQFPTWHFSEDENFYNPLAPTKIKEEGTLYCALSIENPASTLEQKCIYLYLNNLLNKYMTSDTSLYNVAYHRFREYLLATFQTSKEITDTFNSLKDKLPQPVLDSIQPSFDAASKSMNVRSIEIPQIKNTKYDDVIHDIFNGDIDAAHSKIQPELIDHAFGKAVGEAFNYLPFTLKISCIYKLNELLARVFSNTNNISIINNNLNFANFYHAFFLCSNRTMCNFLSVLVYTSKNLEQKTYTPAHRRYTTNPTSIRLFLTQCKEALPDEEYDLLITACMPPYKDIQWTPTELKKLKQLILKHKADQTVPPEFQYHFWEIFQTNVEQTGFLSCAANIENPKTHLYEKCIYLYLGNLLERYHNVQYDLVRLNFPFQRLQEYLLNSYKTAEAISAAYLETVNSIDNTEILDEVRPCFESAMIIANGGIPYSNSQVSSSSNTLVYEDINLLLSEDAQVDASQIQTDPELLALFGDLFDNTATATSEQGTSQITPSISSSSSSSQPTVEIAPWNVVLFQFEFDHNQKSYKSTLKILSAVYDTLLKDAHDLKIWKAHLTQNGGNWSLPLNNSLVNLLKEAIDKISQIENVNMNLATGLMVKVLRDGFALTMDSEENFNSLMAMCKVSNTLLARILKESVSFAPLAKQNVDPSLVNGMLQIQSTNFKWRINHLEKWMQPNFVTDAKGDILTLYFRDEDVKKASILPSYSRFNEEGWFQGTSKVELDAVKSKLMPVCGNAKKAKKDGSDADHFALTPKKFAKFWDYLENNGTRLQDDTPFLLLLEKNLQARSESSQKVAESSSSKIINIEELSKDDGDLLDALNIKAQKRIERKHSKMLDKGRKSRAKKAARVKTELVEKLVDAKPCNLAGHFALEELKPYQIDAVQGAYSLMQADVKGAVFALDMGLGKTLTMAAFAKLVFDNQMKKRYSAPILFIATASTIEQSILEFRKSFQPHAAILGMKIDQDIVQYSSKHRNCRNQRKILFVTSDYRGQEELKTLGFDCVFLDEAQFLNSKGKKFDKWKELVPHSKFHVLSTGTPLQNKLADLFAFLNYLDTATDPKKSVAKFEKLLEKNINLTCREINKLLKQDPAKWNDEALSTAFGSILDVFLMYEAFKKDFVEPLFIRYTMDDPYVQNSWRRPDGKVLIPKLEVNPISLTFTEKQKKVYAEIFSESELDKLDADEASILAAANQFLRLVIHPGIAKISDVNQFDELDISTYLKNKEADKVHEWVMESALLTYMTTPEYKQKSLEGRVIYQKPLIGGKTFQEIFKFYHGVDTPFLQGSLSSESRQKIINSFENPPSGKPNLLLLSEAAETGVNLAKKGTRIATIVNQWNPQRDAQVVNRVRRVNSEKEKVIHEKITHNTTFELLLQHIIDRKLRLKQYFVDSTTHAGNINQTFEACFDLLVRLQPYGSYKKLDSAVINRLKFEMTNRFNLSNYNVKRAQKFSYRAYLERNKAKVVLQPAQPAQTVPPAPQSSVQTSIVVDRKGKRPLDETQQSGSQSPKRPRVNEEDEALAAKLESVMADEQGFEVEEILSGSL